MAKALVLVCLLIASTFADPTSHFLENVFGFPETFYQNAATINNGGPSNGASYVCDAAHLQQSQDAFSSAIGIDGSLNWQNATSLYQAVDTYLSASIDNYLNTCKARKTFYQQMGATYVDCTNPLYLVSQLPAGSDVTPAFAYAAMWAQLDFICNAGLDSKLEYGSFWNFKSFEIKIFSWNSIIQRCYGRLWHISRSTMLYTIFVKCWK
jgi:hypothetical protein